MILKAAQEQSQRPRSKLTEHQTCNASRGGYLTLAAVAKRLQAITWLVARGNKFDSQIAGKAWIPIL